MAAGKTCSDQKSKLAEAIRYALSRWEGLTRFIDDGRIELDNNTVERSIRPICPPGNLILPQSGNAGRTVGLARFAPIPEAEGHREHAMDVLKANALDFAPRIDERCLLIESAPKVAPKRKSRNLSDS